MSAATHNPESDYLTPRNNYEPQEAEYHPRYDPEHVRTAVGNARPPTPSKSSHSKKPFNLDDITEHYYSEDHVLQSYEVYIPDGDTPMVDTKPPRYWVIYIHGGYYRDPRVDATSFHSVLELLQTSPLYSRIRTLVAAYASLNYRLSTHSDFPQDKDTPPRELRNARHPDHINDVLCAIHDLQQKFHFHDRYVLVGHSVGATLAYQVALCPTVPWMPNSKTARSNSHTAVAAAPTVLENENEASRAHPLDPNSHVQLGVTPPLAILGVEGIYSFPLLHETFPSYLDVTRNALLPRDESIINPSDPDAEETYLHLLSPAGHTLATYDLAWRSSHPSSIEENHNNKRIAIIAHSREDSKVDWRQVDSMRRIFVDGSNAGMARVEYDFRVLQLHGDHDAVWGRDGGRADEMAKAIAAALTALKGLGFAGDVKDFATHV